MKIIHGALFLASANISLTRAAPTPTNISTKSEPEILKKGTPASPATAFARSVLPVPGGPASITPFGICAPSLVYLSGFLRKSTISSSSSFSSLSPATSLNVTVLTEPSWFNLALLLAKLPSIPPPCILLIPLLIIINNKISGRNTISNCSITEPKPLLC